MMLPRYKNRQRLRIMECHECHHDYLGHPISKYCMKHRDIKNRKPKKKSKKYIIKLNRIIESKEFDVVDMSLKCALRGCGYIFVIRLYPRQKLYPRFCPEHRTEWKRLYFKQRRKECRPI